MRFFLIGLTFFLIVTHSHAGTFLDDFNDGNMDGWTPMDIGGQAIWKIENGELIFQSNSIGDYINTIGKDNWSDYAVQVKLMVPESVGVVNKLAGIVFRFSGFAAYTVGLSNQGLVSYYFGNAGGQNFQAVPFDWKLGTWYTLKAVVEGIRFKYYVNEKLIMEYTNTLGERGKAGLQASGALVAYFDDFSITGDSILDNAKSVSVQKKLTIKWGRIKQDK